MMMRWPPLELNYIVVMETPPLAIRLRHDAHPPSRNRFCISFYLCFQSSQSCKMMGVACQFLQLTISIQRRTITILTAPLCFERI